MAQEFRSQQYTRAFSGDYVKVKLNGISSNFYLFCIHASLEKVFDEFEHTSHIRSNRHLTQKQVDPWLAEPACLEYRINPDVQGEEFVFDRTLRAELDEHPERIELRHRRTPGSTRNVYGQYKNYQVIYNPRSGIEGIHKYPRVDLPERFGPISPSSKHYTKNNMTGVQKLYQDIVDSLNAYYETDDGTQQRTYAEERLKDKIKKALKAQPQFNDDLIEQLRDVLPPQITLKQINKIKDKILYPYITKKMNIIINFLNDNDIREMTPQEKKRLRTIIKNYYQNYNDQLTTIITKLENIRDGANFNNLRPLLNMDILRRKRIREIRRMVNELLPDNVNRNQITNDTMRIVRRRVLFDGVLNTEVNRIFNNITGHPINMNAGDVAVRQRIVEIIGDIFPKITKPLSLMELRVRKGINKVNAIRAWWRNFEKEVNGQIVRGTTKSGLGDKYRDMLKDFYYAVKDAKNKDREYPSLFVFVNEKFARSLNRGEKGRKANNCLFAYFTYDDRCTFVPTFTPRLNPDARVILDNNNATITQLFNSLENQAIVLRYVDLINKNVIHINKKINEALTLLSQEHNVQTIDMRWQIFSSIGHNMIVVLPGECSFKFFSTNRYPFNPFANQINDVPFINDPVPDNDRAILNSIANVGGLINSTNENTYNTARNAMFELIAHLLNNDDDFENNVVNLRGQNVKDKFIEALNNITDNINFSNLINSLINNIVGLTRNYRTFLNEDPNGIKIRNGLLKLFDLDQDNPRTNKQKIAVSKSLMKFLTNYQLKIGKAVKTVLDQDVIPRQNITSFRLDINDNPHPTDHGREIEAWSKGGLIKKTRFKPMKPCSSIMTPHQISIIIRTTNRNVSKMSDVYRFFRFNGIDFLARKDIPGNIGAIVPAAVPAAVPDGGGQISFTHVSKYLRKLFKENPAKANREMKRLMKMLKV